MKLKFFSLCCEKVILFAIVLFLITNSIFGQFTLTDSLAAFYPFSGNADDASGNENHGTVTNAVFTQDRNGTPASACYFNGSSYITVADANSLDLTSDFSLCLWLKPTDTSFLQLLLEKHYRGEDNDGSWSYFIDHGVVTFTASPYSDWRAHTGKITPDQWVFVAFTFEKASNTWNVYQDGILVNTGSSQYMILPTDKEVSMGYDHPGPFYPATYFFTGCLDEIRIYQRSLSASEIIELFNATSVSVSKYPNASNPLIIKIAGRNYKIESPTNQSSKIEIFDITGKLLESIYYTGHYSGTIDYRHQNIFFIRVSSGAYTQIRKII